MSAFIVDEDRLQILANEAGNLSALLGLIAGRLEDLSGKCPSTIRAVYASSFVAETISDHLQQIIATTKV